MFASIRYSESHSSDSLQIAKSGVYLDLRYMAAKLYSLRDLVHLGYCVTVLHGFRPTCEHSTNQHGVASDPL